jgi:hypothetical protein
LRRSSERFCNSLAGFLVSSFLISITTDNMHAVLTQKRVQTIDISREREATSVARIGFPICEPKGAAAAQVRIVRSTCSISLIIKVAFNEYRETSVDHSI